MTDNTNTSVFIPTSQNDKDTIAGVLKSISNSMTMMEGQRDYIKEAKKSLKKDWGYDNQTIGKLITWYHKQNASTEAEIFEETQDIYDALFPDQN